MDYDLYYKKIGKLYSVHFGNNKALKEDEIKSIFSQFGNIIGINTGNKRRGLCSIKYGTLHETLDCIKGLQNNVSIKLLLEKSKIKSSEVKNDSLDTKNRSDISHSDSDRGLKKQEKQKGTVDRKVVSRDGKNENIIARINSATSKNHNLITYTSVRSKTEVQEIFGTSPRSIDSSNYSGNPFQRVNGQNTIEIPNLVSTDTSVYSEHTELPSSCQSVIEPKTVLAQHVIVANIHPNFGIHYILHLFEKYDPIAISLMKMVPQTSIQYCHIYFKEPCQALEIEKKFDRFLLHGKSLIVLRSNRLTEEAKV